MRISSRTHYGLRAMTELAKAYDQRTLSLSEIASVEHMPLPYLEQLISPLRRAGLIEGTRGACSVSPVLEDDGRWFRLSVARHAVGSSAALDAP